MRVKGVRRHADGSTIDAMGYKVWGPATWKTALATTDLLIMALPLTPETRYLMGVDELAALPPHACVVNVGRGDTLDEAAVLAALRAGRLAGAALDVLEAKPPPVDHPLQAEPKVLLTPHVARSLETPPFRWEPLFVENLRRFAAGEPLLHVVDRQAGY